MFSDFFNLKENPFGETPNTKFFFKSKVHDFAFKEISSVIQSGKGFGLVIGEVGLGKTILCRMFLNYLKNEADTALVFNPTTEPLELINVIANDFNAPEFEKNNRSWRYPLDRLTSFLLSNAEKNKKSILFIDEAQAFSSQTLETIRLLSNLETEKQKLLQIILIGQPELKQKLEQQDLRQLKQRISTLVEIGPMDLADTGNYIRHRIEVAGGANFLKLQDDAIKLIFTQTRGIPRVINFLCESLINRAEKEKLRILNKNFVKRCLPSSNTGFIDRIWRQDHL